MDNLEWEDEFDGSCSLSEEESSVAEHTSLYFYYAKIFERTGSITSLEFCTDHNDGMSKPRQDPHSLDALLMTPLHYAAACGHVDCARILLEHGAQPNAVNSGGYTPLHVGAEYSDMTRLLLKHGGNPNLKTIDSGETCLHMAIRNRNSSVVNILLQTNRVHINETNDFDQTALMCAIINDMNEVANWLIERGARINLQDKEGKTALYYAVLKNNVPLAASLLEHGAHRITSHYLLHLCVHYNWLEMMQLLLHHGDCLNVRNRNDLTPILIAIMTQNCEILRQLLKLKHSQTFGDRIDNELLFAVHHMDTLKEFQPIAQLLLQDNAALLNASQNATPCHVPHCHTPLSRAIMLNKFDIAEFLIKEGTDISQVCEQHVSNHLRWTLAANAVQFTQLLVHCGFKFPYHKTDLPTGWTAERINFEEKMQKLCNTPLKLQYLSRIAIRQHLIKYKLKEFKKSKMSSSNAINSHTPLRNIVHKLEIPKVLQRLLIDFEDCPTVIKLNTRTANDDNDTTK